MGATNHLIISAVSRDGTIEDFDIQFDYGEVREYHYRLGDRIFFNLEGEDVGGDMVIPGIGLATKGNDEKASFRLNIDSLRYFRIVVVNGRIVAFWPTSLEDYEDLKAALKTTRL